MQMDLIYRSSMAKKKPKGECAPTTEQGEARLTDRGGQGGGKGFLLRFSGLSVNSLGRS